MEARVRRRNGGAVVEGFLEEETTPLGYKRSMCERRREGWKRRTRRRNKRESISIEEMEEELEHHPVMERV